MESIIFGKNRHFFGGMEPSNMIEFSVKDDAYGVIINATLPADTVIDGQTLCTVAGAVIRRSTLDYPKDEFDGDLVANITASTVISDTDIVVGNTYYYSAFPYTTQGVYNRNIVNRASINEPGNMVKFSSKSVYDYTTDKAIVEITAKISEGVAGAVIRRSTSGYPLNENDGDEFITITSDGVYSDENVSMGTIYYYSAFPYNAAGTYNRNQLNYTHVKCAKYSYLYGFDIDINDPNPDTRVSYPSDVENANFTPAAMNFIDNMFDYGDWNIAPGEQFMPRPCMLKYNGVVDHYLDPNDYSLQDDGVTASRVADTTFNGNAMMEWPKIYTHREETDGVYKFRCSDMPQGEGWDCWCNYDINDNQIDHFYTSIYYGYKLQTDNYKIRSISKKGHTTSESLNDFAQYACNNGDDWTMGVLADHLLIQDLLILMSKTTDCQIAFGYGCFNNGGTSDTKTSSGTMDTLGMFWGGITYKDSVKIFGMEHWWGNQNRYIAGWLADMHSGAGDQRVKITRGTHDGSTKSDYVYNSSPYYYLKIEPAISFSDGNIIQKYIRYLNVKPYGRIPSTAYAGSSTTYEADIIYASRTAYSTSGGLAAVSVGGSNAYGKESVGPFFVTMNTGINSTPTFGVTLSCKPRITENE